MANERSDEVVVASSGNGFADLGLKNSDEKQTKVRLAVAINEILRQRRFSQVLHHACCGSINSRSLL